MIFQFYRQRELKLKDSMLSEEGISITKCPFFHSQTYVLDFIIFS